MLVRNWVCMFTSPFQAQRLNSGRVIVWAIVQVSNATIQGISVVATREQAGGRKGRWVFFLLWACCVLFTCEQPCVGLHTAVLTIWQTTTLGIQAPD